MHTITQIASYLHSHFLLLFIFISVPSIFIPHLTMLPHLQAHPLIININIILMQATPAPLHPSIRPPPPPHRTLAPHPPRNHRHLPRPPPHNLNRHLPRVLLRPLRHHRLLRRAQTKARPLSRLKGMEPPRAGPDIRVRVDPPRGAGQSARAHPADAEHRRREGAQRALHPPPAHGHESAGALRGRGHQDDTGLRPELSHVLRFPLGAAAPVRRGARPAVHARADVRDARASEESAEEAVVD